MLRTVPPPSRTSVPISVYLIGMTSDFKTDFCVGLLDTLNVRWDIC